MGVATTELIDPAAVQAKALGTDPACVFVPHPVQDRTDEELRQAVNTYFERILALLVAKR